MGSPRELAITLTQEESLFKIGVFVEKMIRPAFAANPGVSEFAQKGSSFFSIFFRYLEFARRGRILSLHSSSIHIDSQITLYDLDPWLSLHF